MKIFWNISFEISGLNYVDIYKQFFQSFLWCLPFVLITNLVSYSFFGFYTRGRYYSGRYKLLCVLQAVSIAYLVVALIAFMTQGRLIPRSVLPISWVITSVIVALARLWAIIWRFLILQEEPAKTHQKYILQKKKNKFVVSTIEL